MLEEKEDSSALDAALIASAQKVEHYEIASYGTLCTWARIMGHREALQFLKANLSEEEAADKKLTNIAQSVANPKAQR
jgi:ferritin-like metal-binding protein YciE